MSSAATSVPDSPSAGETAAGVLAWVRRDPVGALLLALIAGVLIYFFGFYRVFMNGGQSTAEWAWSGWNDENDQVHCRFLVPIIAVILWLRRGDLMSVVKAPSARGLAFVFGGIVLFVLAVRCLQPRIAIVAVPLIVYGAAEFLGGRQFARIFIFPCLLMLFMVPIGGVIQGTVSLQLLASKAVGVLCGLLGIHVQIIGTTIHVDGHSFEVAGGCSGIRSLMAMSMLAALYVYFTQKEAWKRWVIFGCSILFALVGNIARLFSVVLVAKWWNPEIAGGPYHDLSGLIVFFPSAVLVMVAFGNLLNRDWSGAGARIAKTITAPEAEPGPKTEADGEESERKPASPISYDY
ncbi:MAG: exosortase [Chthoniobacter sp.]|uniref:exosortase/archaeosortase family protein n=1 Tax=Chthoniobacter sp. TaxID=2510640 RepID=UPI0032AE1EBC